MAVENRNISLTRRHPPSYRTNINNVYIILLVPNPPMYNTVYGMYLNNDSTHINGRTEQYIIGVICWAANWKRWLATGRNK